MSKCPYCFRKGIWSKDPLLLPTGSKFKWSDENETTLIEEPDLGKREYKGFYQVSESEIQEIRNKLSQLESENLPEEERTQFSPINNGGIFQFKGIHLKEMRESVEKLLEVSGYTKQEYFNYDEEGNHIISPLGDRLNWTDNVINEEDWDSFQIKAIHIEELRHYISIIWYENWDVSDLGVYAYGYSDPLNPFVPLIPLIADFIQGDKGKWYANHSSNPPILDFGVCTARFTTGTYAEARLSIISLNRIFCEMKANAVYVSPILKGLSTAEFHLIYNYGGESIYVDKQVNPNTDFSLKVVDLDYSRIGDEQTCNFGLLVQFECPPGSYKYIAYIFDADYPLGEENFAGQTIYYSLSTGTKNRNLYDDFVACYPSIDEEALTFLKFKRIGLNGQTHANASGGVNVYTELNLSLDNLQVG